MTQARIPTMRVWQTTGGGAMRANLFTYRDMDDPWLREMRNNPQDTLFALMPNLRGMIGDFAASGQIKIRPVDLYVTHNYRQPGVVLVGDAFSTSCPAAGTGARKVLTDVERLCNVYIPQWLRSGGMDAGKIAAFYDDPVKRARRVAVLQHVEATFDPLPYDQGAARLYGQICAAVRAAGREPRKRAADLMIAATAASNELPLYTANPDDFKGIDSLVEVVGVRGCSNNL